MFTLTLEPNQSNPRRYVAVLSYERKGDKVTPVRRVYDGPNHCVSTQVVPWPRKDWCDAPNGEKGTHGRPFTIKRDWVILHTHLDYWRSGGEL